MTDRTDTADPITLMHANPHPIETAPMVPVPEKAVRRPSGADVTETAPRTLDWKAGLGDTELACYRAGRTAGLLEAADMLQTPRAKILLAVGEMTAQEMRTAKAVLSWHERLIRSKAHD